MPVGYSYNLNMKKLISIVVTFFVFTSCGIFFTTCQREYSYEGGISNGTASGTAVYSLNGAGGACTGSIIMGEYYAGTPLGPSNAIQLQVNVDSIGTYSLSTNSTNGMQFTTSGIFTNTGMQTITLTGTGTPVSDGSFTFNTPVGLGCSFTVMVTTAPPAIASFTLEGAPDNCSSAIINGTYTPGIALTNGNTIVISVNVTTIGAYSINTDTLNGINFSMSGIFTSTGIQTVTLVGSGTPDFSRNLSFAVFAGTSSCTLNVVVQDPGPLATYVLEGGSVNGLTCVYSVLGTYTSNTPLSNSNTVTIRAYVTAIGNFTIATNTINGMIFSYTGSFTTTGTHFVILTGTGTPITQGTYTFIAMIVGPHPIGGEACAFYVAVQ